MYSESCIVREIASQILTWWRKPFVFILFTIFREWILRNTPTSNQLRHPKVTHFLFHTPNKDTVTEHDVNTVSARILLAVIGIVLKTAPRNRKKNKCYNKKKIPLNDKLPLDIITPSPFVLCARSGLNSVASTSATIS